MKAIVLLCILAVAIAKPIIDVDIINTVNSGNHGWKAGINHNFIGKSHEDAKRLCGTFLEGGEQLPARPVFENEKAAPESFDAREQWGNDCPSTKEIRDQSNCGSCWAFGAVEAMTDRICIASQGAQKFHLSAADMLSCCGSCGSGCSGGYPSSAWSYWRSTGLVTGGNYKEGLCYPYQLEPCDHHVNGTLKPCPAIVPTPRCTKKCENGADWNADKHFGASTYSVGGEEAMKTELANHGPFEVAFTVYEDFLSYRSGVYHHVTGAYEGGHAVKVIGYGTENGQKYWTIANSWNTEWGDKGTFKILRGKNECGIEGQGVAGLPKL